MIVAPFTAEQVERLNAWQVSGTVHPFTCRRRTDTPHLDYGSGDFGVLIATKAGWVCRDCDYTQNWAHDFMAQDANPFIGEQPHDYIVRAIEEHAGLWADEIRRGE